MKSMRHQTVITVVCVVLGLLLAYQFQSAKSGEGTYQDKRFERISQQLKDQTAQKAELEQYVSDLEKKIQEYEKSAASTGDNAKNIKDELEKVRTFAGLNDAAGPGISITLKPDSTGFDNKEPAYVEAFQILLIVNELNACGAEAISINGQRIVNVTQIRDVGVGQYIVINDVRQPATESFEIKAIGDSDAIEKWIDITSGVKQALADYGIVMQVQKSNSVKISKFNKGYDLKYAKPEKEGE
jgi:uncharacterized protein YlxW (UPF0749 family)